MLFKKHIIFFIFMITTSSCSNSQGIWNEINPNGLKGQNLSLNYLFLNDKKAILLGINATDEDVINKKYEKHRALIYSSDDSCHDWTNKQIGNGDFTSATTNGNFVCAALNLDKFGDLTDQYKDSTSIYFSNDFGGSWIKISSFSRLYVRDIFCLSDNDIYLIAKETGSAMWSLLYTNNKGCRWDTIQTFSQEVRSPVFLNECIFFLSQKNVIKYSLKTKKSDLINTDLDAYFLSVRNKELYISGINRNNKFVQIEKLTSLLPYQFKQIAEIREDKFPINFYVTNNGGLVSLLGEKNPFGVTYSIYYRKNGGKEGILKFPSATFEPYAYNDNLMYVYSYSGIIYNLRFN